MISGNMLIDFLVLIVAVAVVWWLLGLLGVPEPTRKIFLIVMVVILVISFLYFLIGSGNVRPLFRR